jgi:hypothetical protein
MQGLNSTTFNYLEQNKAAANVEDGVIEYRPQLTIDSKSFLQTNVRNNRPGVFRQMAKKWKIVENKIDLLDVLGGD